MKTLQIYYSRGFPKWKGERWKMKLIYEKCGNYLVSNLLPNPEPEGDDEEKLFGKSSSGNLFGDAVRGNIERASAHDTGAGRRKV